MKKLIITAVILLTSLQASSAISGTRLFTQADGTQFEGVLRGDSSFHWIESNGVVVKYNPNDKFYYKAIIDETQGIILTTQKPATTANRSASLTNISHKVSQEKKEKLSKLFKKTKIGNFAR